MARPPNRDLDAVLGDLQRSITGLHHVRIPVTHAWPSRDWYAANLGFIPVMDVEEENELVGVVMHHPSGLVIGLHQDPQRAVALSGFALLDLGIPDLGQLDAWIEHLDRLGVAHGVIQRGHLGWYVELRDPDGIVTRLHTSPAPYAEDA